MTTDKKEGAQPISIYATWSPMERKWRCSKGHEWSGYDWEGKNPISITSPLGREFVFCWECLIDFLEQHCGRVEEVK